MGFSGMVLTNFLISILSMCRASSRELSGDGRGTDVNLQIINLFF